MFSTPRYAELVQNRNIIWKKYRDQVQKKAHESGIFNIEKMAEGTGSTVTRAEIDRQLYANNKAEGGQKSEGKIQIGYEKSSTLVYRGDTFTETYEMKQQGKYVEFDQILKSIGTLVPERRELDLNHRITFGTATSYTDKGGDSVDISVGDGLALFSTAHTLKASSTTFRNILANNPQFSEGALELMEQMVADNSMNSYGQKTQRKFDIIWSADNRTTCNNIKKVLKSTAGVTDINSGVTNVNLNKYRHVELPLVATDASGNNDTTKQKYWGLASSDSDIYLDILEDNKVTMLDEKGNTYDPRSEVGYYTCYGAYAITATGGKSITLSKGDASA